MNDAQRTKLTGAERTRSAAGEASELSEKLASMVRQA
jgi:hypothetical protein